MKTILLLLVTSFCLQAEDLTIKWAAPPKKSDIVGYYFLLESQSGVTVKNDIGFRTKYTFSILDDRWYQIKIVPYSINKVEGEPSNVLKYKANQKPVKIELPAPSISIEKN